MHYCTERKRDANEWIKEHTHENEKKKTKSTRGQ